MYIVQAIKRQFRVQWQDWLWMNLIILVSSIAGMVLFQVIVRIAGDELEEWFAMGTVIGGMCALMFLLIMSMVQISIHFNAQISMGSTRKQFIISWLVVGITEAVAAVLLVTGICFCENKLFGVIYSGIPNEINFLPYLLKYGVLAAMAATILGNFCGTLVMRFGKVAFWILWALWMFGCLGLPRITEAIEEAPNSFYGKVGSGIGHFLQGIPVSMWVILVLGICGAALAVTYGILRKQPVTV